MNRTEEILEEIKWKPVVGYEALYEVSDAGEVFGLTRKGIIKSFVSHRGYPLVSLFNKGKRGFSVHRLVAKAFIPNPDNLPEVNHKNGIKTDNRVENLEWCTSQANIDHSVATGLWKPNKGSNHGTSILDEKKVLYIRDKYASGVSATALSNEMGVAKSTIQNIAARISWKHI